jgi:hypothetical protein
MVNIHDRECRDFGIDQVFRLVVPGVTVPTAFHGFVYSEWICFHKFSERGLREQM